MSIENLASVVGIVTVTFNSAEVLPDFLSSVEAQHGIRVRLYAVDSASTDRTLEILESYRDRLDLVVVPNERNVGFAEGSNQGIERAIGDEVDWIFLLNNDTYFPNDAVANLARDAEAHGIDIVSPLIEATDPPGSVWYAGGDIVRWQGMKPRHKFAGEQMAVVPRALKRVPYASMCALLVRPAVFERVGLIDTIYFVYYEDIDFAIRLTDAGYEFWLSPSTIITHKASSLTGGPASPFFIRWRSRNWVLIARRHTHLLGTVVALAYIQTWAMARVVVGRDSWATWRLRQRSFLEGLTASTKTATPQLAPREIDA